MAIDCLLCNIPLNQVNCLDSPEHSILLTLQKSLPALNHPSYFPLALQRDKTKPINSPPYFVNVDNSSSGTENNSHANLVQI